MDKDYFDMNFDMTRYPEDLKKVEWKNRRKELSNFFIEFDKYYRNAIKERSMDPFKFIMTRPYHMLFAINDKVLYFAVTNVGAYMGRCCLYKLKDGGVLNTDIIQRTFRLSGLGYSNDVNGVISDIDYKIINDFDSERIKQEAYGFVDYEVKEMKKEHKIMDIVPYFGEIKFQVNENKIFMLMPFADTDMNEFYEDYIKEPLTEKDFNCLRADDIFNNKSIIEDIWRNINESRIIIADLTHRNPNVFYEIGIAHTLGKDVILISQEEEDIPFDLRHIRTIFYKITPRGAEQFTEERIKTIDGLVNGGELDQNMIE